MVGNHHQEEIEAAVQVEQRGHSIDDQSMARAVVLCEQQDQTSASLADHIEVAAEKTPQGLQAHTKQLSRHQVLVVDQETWWKEERRVLH